MLTLLTLGLYLLFAKSGKFALRTLAYVLAADGLILIIIHVVATAVVHSQAQKATESLAREAIPIVASSLLSPLISLGIFEILLGVIAFGLTFLKRVNVNRQG